MSSLFRDLCIFTISTAGFLFNKTKTAVRYGNVGSLTINGESVDISIGQWYDHEQSRWVKPGDWSKTFTLSEGENTFTIVGKNDIGGTVTETRTVTYTINAPTIRLYNCPERTTYSKVNLSGNVTGSNGTVQLTLNDQSITLDSEGNFNEEVTLAPGSNTFTFRAVDAMGKDTVITKTVIYETDSED